MSTEADLAQALRKPKTHKGRKIVDSRKPQVHEPSKRTLILKGNKTNMQVQHLLLDLFNIKKPDAVYLSSRRQTDLHPFEDVASAEYLCKKNQCPIFCLASSSKKRPFRLVVGRMFADNLLDMMEFSVKSFTPMSDFKGIEPNALGSKPLVIFQGAGFEGSEVMRAAQSLLADLLRGPKPPKICLKGIDHLIVVSALEAPSQEQSELTGSAHPPIHIKHYRVNFKKSGTKLPRVELAEMGPGVEMTVDRYRLPDAARWKLSMMLPKEEKPKKEKNVSTNVLGEKRGRIHLGRQNLEAIHTPHAHVFKKRKVDTEGADEAMASAA